MFISATSLKETLALVQDYNNNKNFYNKSGASCSKWSNWFVGSLLPCQITRRSRVR